MITYHKHRILALYEAKINGYDDESICNETGVPRGTISQLRNNPTMRGKHAPILDAWLSDMGYWPDFSQVEEEAIQEAPSDTVEKRIEALENEWAELSQNIRTLSDVIYGIRDACDKIAGEL